MSEPTRRSFLDSLLFTSLAATAAAGLAPVPFFLLPSAEARPRRRATVGKSPEFGPGASRTFMLGDRPAVVVNDGELRAFDLRCTHAQCPVSWEGSARLFKCPCHGATFSSKGEPLGGPAKGPLVSLKLEVTAAGDVVVGD